MISSLIVPVWLQINDRKSALFIALQERQKAAQKFENKDKDNRKLKFAIFLMQKGNDLQFWKIKVHFTFLNGNGEYLLPFLRGSA